MPAVIVIVYLALMLLVAVYLPKKKHQLLTSPKYYFYLCFFFGMFGVHRFRQGKKGTGFLYLFTIGIFLFGWLVDLIRLAIASEKGTAITPVGKNAPPVQEPVQMVLSPDDPLPTVFGSGILLTKGETCHYYGNATQIIIKNQVVGYTGGSSGVSLRVAKGVSYRVGSRRGAPVREDVQQQIPGMLSITNKRVVFSSARESFDKKLATISSATPMDDGIVLQFGDKQYILLTDESHYIYQIISRIVQESDA